jgi:hypothetical protein
LGPPPKPNPDPKPKRAATAGSPKGSLRSASPHCGEGSDFEIDECTKIHSLFPGFLRKKTPCEDFRETWNVLHKKGGLLPFDELYALFNAMKKFCRDERDMPDPCSWLYNPKDWPGHFKKKYA